MVTPPLWVGGEEKGPVANPSIPTSRGALVPTERSLIVDQFISPSLMFSRTRRDIRLADSVAMTQPATSSSILKISWPTFASTSRLKASQASVPLLSGLTLHGVRAPRGLRRPPALFGCRGAIFDSRRLMLPLVTPACLRNGLAGKPGRLPSELQAILGLAPLFAVLIDSQECSLKNIEASLVY